MNKLVVTTTNNSMQTQDNLLTYVLLTAPKTLFWDALFLTVTPVKQVLTMKRKVPLSFKMFLCLFSGSNSISKIFTKVITMHPLLLNFMV